MREAKQGEEMRQDMREVKRMGDDDVGFRANYRAIQWSEGVMICGTTGETSVSLACISKSDDL